MLNFFDVGGRMVLVDAPGYGDRGRPEWGALFSCPQNSACGWLAQMGRER
jgi:hypothetical protein